MSTTFNPAGESNVARFVVAYAPTGTSESREGRDKSWTELISTVNRIPNNHHPFTLTDANARTGQDRRGDLSVVGASGRNYRSNDSIRRSRLQFAGDNRLALVDTLFPPTRKARRVHSTVCESSVLATSLHGNITAGLLTMSFSTLYHPTGRTLITTCAPQCGASVASHTTDLGDPYCEQTDRQAGNTI